MSSERLDLRADCTACAGLCCVVPAFSVSADFALDKPSGVPCPHLAASFGCEIHEELPERGFTGCTVYDCFGAGQRVVAAHGGGWRDDPELRRALQADFEVVERLHELLWYLVEAARLTASHRRAASLRGEVEGLRDAVERAVEEVDGAAVTRFQARADVLLGEVSAVVRRPAGADLRGYDLAGRDLRQQELEAASLRGAVLIGADLRGVVLAGTDLLGADVRRADASGADLRDALFLTQSQVNALRGDAATLLPDTVLRPAHYRRDHG
jgi:uncharacterized protein YjbI with pentapeptide repeats